MSSSLASPSWRRREAAEWVVEHESAQELSPVRLSAWEAWIGDADNRAEYASMVGLRHDVQALGRQSLPTSESLLEDSFDVDEPPFRSDMEGRGRSIGQPRTGRRRRPLAAVAAVVLLACAAAWSLAFWHSRSGVVPNGAQTFATRPGEQRAFTLADGSQMTLGGNTAAVVRFTTRGRTVVLSRGEGLFHVQHDPSRPFLVCAAQACVTAVGTTFDVHLYAGRVQVSVQEGIVEVAPMQPVADDRVIVSAVQWSPLRLQHGQEMSYAADGDMTAPVETDARMAAAWTQGSLIYHGRPLSEVIEDVQRYSSRPILLDPAAADLHYSGSVIQQHVDQWIHGLADIFPVEIVDCRTVSPLSPGSRTMPPSCLAVPDRILIRSRMTP